LVKKKIPTITRGLFERHSRKIFGTWSARIKRCLKLSVQEAGPLCTTNLERLEWKCDMPRVLGWEGGDNEDGNPSKEGENVTRKGSFYSAHQG